MYKKILLSLISAFTTVLLVYGGYTIYAETNSVPDFREGGLDFPKVFDRYHGEMNTYFNGKLEKLNLLVENPDFFRDKQKFYAPTMNKNDDIKTIVSKCGEENVSSYCVSMGALSIYMDYVRVLNRLQGELKTPAGDTFIATDILTETSARNAEIKKEIESSKNVMKAAVGAYNEYRLAYSMHKKYQEIIENLIKYKLAIKDVLKQSSQFPINFIDVTTSQCE